MIEEAYCSYEVSKLLKEKGFPMREHSMMYTNKNNVCLTEYAIRRHLSREDYLHFEDFFIPTITHQMAVAWLIKIYRIFIEVYLDSAPNFEYVFRPVVWDNSLNCVWRGGVFTTCEEAIEASLKYSLENLI